MDKKRIILGVSGASGAPLAERLLRELKAHPEIEMHLVVTDGGERTIEEECAISPEDFKSLADVVYDNRDIGAAIASGSFSAQSMIVLPCSMKTVAGIASGFTTNLLLRAADVCIKEGRKLVLAPREMPLSRIHLRNIKEAADNGCIIVPPVLTFYNGADSIEKQIRHIIGKILMQFGIAYEPFQPWQGNDNLE